MRIRFIILIASTAIGLFTAPVVASAAVPGGSTQQTKTST